MSQADPGYRTQNDSVIAAASVSQGPRVCWALTAAAAAAAEGSLCTRYSNVLSSILPRRGGR